MNNGKVFEKSDKNLSPKLSCTEDDCDELNVGENNEKREEKAEHDRRKGWKLSDGFARFIRYIQQGVYFSYFQQGVYYSYIQQGFY